MSKRTKTRLHRDFTVAELKASVERGSRHFWRRRGQSDPSVGEFNAYFLFGKPWMESQNQEG